MPPLSSPLGRCPGTLPRRGFLQMGVSALGGLSLAELLRRQAEAKTAGGRKNEKALIVLWLWGGASHMETFDLKPEAPVEFRGDFKPIDTPVSGLRISEHLPQLARLGDRFSLLRSMSHESNGHVNSTHTMLTGYPGEVNEAPPFHPKYPDFWSVAHRVAGTRRAGVPPHVAMPRMRYNGSAWLGGSLDPFVVSADPNVDGFRVPNVGLGELPSTRFDDRLDLLRQVDTFRRAADTTGMMDSLDTFQRQAAGMLSSGAVERAFRIQDEDPRVRERYGRHEVGQRCLMARRLVEAGVRMVTVDFPCVPGQKAFSWDDHASVWNIFEEMKIRLPVLDQVCSALIEDLAARGMDKEVLFVVTGEMSHTPRLSNVGGQPGREHWARTMSVFLSGGGLRMGQAIGSSGPKGDEPVERVLAPNDLLATLYRHFGIPSDMQFVNHAGRPTPILPSGRAIDELIG